MDTSENLFRSSFFLLNAGFVALIIFALCVTAIIVWHYRRTFKDAITIMNLILLLLSVPVGVVLVVNRTRLLPQAEVEIRIEDLRVLKQSDNSVLITFSTSQPALSYIEYEDIATNKIRPITSKDGLQKTTKHVIQIEDIGPLGGKAVFIINAKRYLIDEKPLVIK